MELAMYSVSKTSRILGVAFLLQFSTSFISGVVISQALIVPGNISESMIKIANNPGLMRADILLDMLTALGVIFLGAILFITLKKQNEIVALVALGFYILEAALLAASKLDTYALLRISQEYITSGQPANLELMGKIAYEAMDFVGNTLHMLAFCVGGTLFYFLLDQARIVPRLLSLWGLITVLPCMVGTLGAVFGYQLPFAIYLPYVPFEFVIGIWMIAKGIRSDPELKVPVDE